MTREIVLDTETTGMDPETGDRLVEIGCVELMNYLPTGRTLQLYINPERPVPPEAVAVHGLTNEFLSKKPVFSQVYTEFTEFIEGARLVIHNAEFDMKFINWELKQVGHEPVAWSRVTDTLALARQKFPGSPANLDALCRRFEIDASERVFHGALLDSQLLAEVYLELLGGRQRGLLEETETTSTGAAKIKKAEKIYREPRVFAASETELEAHARMVAKLKDALWKNAA